MFPSVNEPKVIFLPEPTEELETVPAPLNERVSPEIRPLRDKSLDCTEEFPSYVFVGGDAGD